MISAERAHYKRNFLISLIISEAIIILTFEFFPVIQRERIETLINEQIIFSDIVPPTRQNVKKIISPKRPPIRQISEEIDAFDLLEDVKITVAALTETEPVESKIENVHTGLLDVVPRLSLEVLPDNKDGQLNGRLSLSIKISKMGNVIGHKILLNSLDCEGCIDKVISAVYKSKWEPAVRNGVEAEYWVQKSYIFN